METEIDFTKLKNCRLCPRLCGVDRLGGQPGLCGATGQGVTLARAGLHMWEEPCISGKMGSGTVFFTGCNLGCVFCQNREISRGRGGITVPVERLAEIFLELQEQGAHNVNLVTPTHYACHIAGAVDMAREMGLTVPVVYNTGGYELPETIDFLGARVQIYLTDFKYWDRQLSLKYSRAENYRAEAIKALDAMVNAVGSPEFQSNGIMQAGVIVRHLVLPGAWEDSIRLLGFLHRRYGDNIYLSVMNQYTPPAGVALPKELEQPLAQEEYGRVLEFMEDIGVEQGYTQYGGTVSESFIPEFRGQGVLKSSNFML